MFEACETAARPCIDFRGVRIGTVKDIRVVYDTDTNELKIPVIFEVDLDRLTVVGSGKVRSDDDDGDILIERGMRAQLELRSLVTGQLAVNLDFFPGSPIVYRGGYLDYEEYPTVPSQAEQVRSAAETIIRRLKDVPVDEIAKEILVVLEGIDDLVSSEDLAGLLDGADRLANSPDLEAAIAGLRRAMENANATMTSVRRLAENADAQLTPMADGLKEVSEDLGEILDQAARVLNSVEASLDEDSDLRVRTITAMEEVAGAARSVRIRADYIQRHPEALVKGKKEAGR